MTGEISLHGRVLPIGGLKEKTMAAYSAGVKTVLIPIDNERDLADIDPLARENMTFVPCKTINDVLKVAILRPKTDNATEQKSFASAKPINAPVCPRIDSAVHPAQLSTEEGC
jgi:ATP-dependent Lon protease